MKIIILLMNMRKKRLRFYKEMMMSKFVHLKKVVNNFDGEQYD